MADEIKLNYPMAEEMIQSFKAGAQQIQETIQEMLTIAGMMEDGGLRGRTGQLYVEALRNQFVPALNRLNNKFDELADDVQKAIDFMKEADAQSAQIQGD